MLKADIHIHTGEDDYHPEIRYNAKDLINYAAQLGFEVISITNHSKVTFTKSLSKYAAKRGILLIPGVEHRIEGRDVLIYNITKKQSKKLKTFDDLRKLNKKSVLIIAPHPYYPVKYSLRKKLLENIDIFDAIEYSHFYSKYMNRPNKKAAKVAHDHKKPLVGTSDAHHLWRLNTTYTLIDSENTVNCVINAIKKNKVKLYSRHLSLTRYLKVIIWILYFKIYRKLCQLKHKIYK